MITQDELNPSLKAFLRNDWDFKSYIADRTESNEDLNFINDVLKSGGDTSTLPSDKIVMKQMFDTPEPKVQEMISLSKDSDLYAYVGTKIVTKIYDDLINDKMRNEHQAEQKPEEERSDAEKRKLQQLRAKMGLQMAKLMKSASEEFATVVAIANAMSKANDGTSNHMELDPSTIIDMARKSDEMLAKIMKLVGHFQGCFDHKLRTSSDAHQIRCGIKMGNEIQNLLPTEILFMMDEDFESLKMLDFVQKNTLQYKFKGKTPQTGGPIVCCIDETGSMSGERIELAKAFCFGLFQQAKKQNRSFQVLRFGRYGHCEKAVIKNGFDLIEISKQFMCDGSTDFETPLKTAMEIIKSERDYEKADIIMITDGESRVDDKFIDDFNSFKSQTNTKLVTLSIEKWYKDYGLGKMSDTVIFGADFDRLVDLV